MSDSENEVDIVEETLNVGCVTNQEFLKLTTSTCNYEDKENLGYENFENFCRGKFANIISLQRQGMPTDYKSRVSFQKVLTSCLQLPST
jgi:hypothetical protein